MKQSRSGWRYEFDDLIRGASGGFLFGIPLIYTMEVWWIGSYATPSVLLGILAITFGIVWMLNRTDGFRQASPDSSLEATQDSIEALAIGLLCTTCTLILLGEIRPETSLSEALGKIIFESVPFAIGVAVARSILNSDRRSSDSNPANPNTASNSRSTRSPQSTGQPKLQQNLSHSQQATLNDIGAALIGAVFVGISIAPTDEIPMLAAAASPPWLIAIILASLIISYGIVFAAGFTAQQRRRQQQGIFQTPLTETVIAYLVSLLAAALMLWFFHRLSFSDPWTLWLSETLLMGLPTTIGGAAGRLAV
ncbi:MAG: TIGR02587 family membrane protein [Oculatellaceae cyanobacterium Prado106]|nr:TIGR02587 family membrane protein [Oculatellaceae cyanobacterium Prado106]